jgi:hypothetical protein
MKRHYQVPTIKVVSFKVEEGFASQLNIGDQDATVFSTVTNGTETYDSESWTARPYQQR